MKLPLSIVRKAYWSQVLQIADATGKVVCTMPSDDPDARTLAERIVRRFGSDAMSRDEWISAKTPPEFLEAYNNGTLKPEVERI